MYWLYGLLGLVTIAALFLAATDGAALTQNQAWSVPKAWTEAKRHAWRGDFIVMSLRCVGALMILPLFLYLISGWHHKDFGEGSQEAADYAVFVLPALAGSLAGLGLVTGRKEGEVVNDVNVNYYIGSVFILWTAYAIYLWENFSPLVFGVCGATLSITGTVAFIRREEIRKKCRKDETYLERGGVYEICHIVVLFFPPLLLLLLIGIALKFWRGF
jgi:ABC-type Fe3+ transport system permease subunit